MYNYAIQETIQSSSYLFHLQCIINISENNTQYLAFAFRESGVVCCGQSIFFSNHQPAKSVVFPGLPECKIQGDWPF